MGSDFLQLKDEFLNIWAYFNPFSAASEGLREYSGILPEYNLEKIEVYKFKLNNFANQLSEIDFEALTTTEQVEYDMFLNKLDSELFKLDIMNLPTKNPLFYLGGAMVYEYLLKNYAPIEIRLKHLIIHLNQLDNYYTIARKNLILEKISPEIANVAIAMLAGSLSFLENIADEIRKLVNNIPDDLIRELIQAGAVGAHAVKDYMDFLKSGSDIFSGNFRLGKERFEQMLRMVERVDLSIDEILNKGEMVLEKNFEAIVYAANQIDPDLPVDEILTEIKKDHPTIDSLVSDTQEMLEDIRNFIIDTEFVSVPSDVIPKVIYTPKPFREFMFAAMDTPGALEKKATDAYYYITPPDESWPQEDQEAWLQTFNYPGLLDVSVHEVFPGHYLHHLHNQQSEYTFSKLFGAYHFWEGWGLYVEDAMWHQGFQKGDYRYRMSQLIETLLRDVRLINAIRLHTDPDYTLADATKLFMEKAYLGKKPAEAEAQRATFDPGYLNYTLGKMMIEKLKLDYMEEKKEEFDLKKFHNELLSYGAPPIPIVRKYMLSNKNIHDEIL